MSPKPRKTDPKPPGWFRRRIAPKVKAARRIALPYAAWLVPFTVAAVVLSAWWPLIFALGGITHLAGDRLRLHYGWHRRGGKAAARKRRAYQGEATISELARNLGRDEGVLIGSVRRLG
jgi:hypothetical protein